MFIDALTTIVRELFLEDSSRPRREAAEAERKRHESIVREQTSVAGLRGKAVTPLRPVGIVKIDGRRRDAESDGKFIEVGADIEVIRASGYLLIVRELAGNEQQ